MSRIVCSIVNRETGGGAVGAFAEDGLVADFFIDSPFLGVPARAPNPRGSVEFEYNRAPQQR
jgi:hypothetical protein